MASSKTLLDAAHRAIVEAFGVPERDRYQIVHEHRASRIVVEDTGRPSAHRQDRPASSHQPQAQEEAKGDFYPLFCEELEKACGIGSSDVLVSFVENGDEDWSFGLGSAQCDEMQGRQIWIRFATWILLALVAIAADLVRTAVAPIWDDIAKLAVIATIRTMVNYFLAKDIAEFEPIERSGGSPPPA